MAELMLAISLFTLTHGLAAVRPIRAVCIRCLGERLYITIFSAVSLGMLVWLGSAYAAAPYIEIWPYVPVFKWIPIVIMPAACVLLIAGLTTPNPFSLGAGAAGFDPDRPGIVGITRHPAVWALFLWSVSHIPINGDAASLIVFGLLSGLAPAGIISLDAKRKCTMGAEVWRGQSAKVRRLAKTVALHQTGWRRLAAGLVLYGALLSAHELVIGISPLPQ
ncbi:MAG: hypothetical protein HOF27_17205 [Rhodospirillaceae bacterium]|nr:hypothetical protein [Rhodospirillaceae bacterium]